MVASAQATVRVLSLDGRFGPPPFRSLSGLTAPCSAARRAKCSMIFYLRPSKVQNCSILFGGSSSSPETWPQFSGSSLSSIGTTASETAWNPGCANPPRNVVTSTLYRDYRQLLIRCLFPIDYDQRSIDGPLDLDLHVALLARDGKLKFAELPVLLSTKELLQLGMKSAALWSLLSMAQQHESVALLCVQESPKPGSAAQATPCERRRTVG